jgi:hypothetical protein
MPSFWQEIVEITFTTRIHLVIAVQRKASDTADRPGSIAIAAALTWATETIIDHLGRVAYVVVRESEVHYRPEDPRRCLLLGSQTFEVVEAVLLGTGDVLLQAGVRQPWTYRRQRRTQSKSSQSFCPG